MKKISPLKTAITILGLSTALSLVGSISGTIAWYAYTTRALVSYTGTSVQSTTQLQIGIKSDIPINFTTNASLIDDVTFSEDLYYDEVNDPHRENKLYANHYYFMKVGSGGMPAAIINDYLSAKGYATNVLEPLSSYSYTPGGLLYQYNDIDDFWEVKDARFSGSEIPSEHQFKNDIVIYENDIYHDLNTYKYYFYNSSDWIEITNIQSGNPNEKDISGASDKYYIDSDANEFNLRNRPTTNKPDLEPTPAETTKYVEIPFVFRVLSTSSETLSYIENHEVFLSGAQAIAAPNLEGSVLGNEIHNSIRLYIDRTNGNDYILNPSSETNGRDKVAGVLNLTGGASGTGCYDYDNTISSPTYMQEFLYGDYEWKKDKNWSNSLSKHGLAQDSELVDINGTGNSNVETTFTSRHRKDVRYFSDLNSCITPHYANYLGTKTVFPETNAQGQYVGKYAVCKTGGESSHFLGLFKMKIYLEGWDFSVVDSQLQNKFYLGLTFQINIVK